MDQKFLVATSSHAMPTLRDLILGDNLIYFSTLNVRQVIEQTLRFVNHLVDLFYVVIYNIIACFLNVYFIKKLLGVCNMILLV